MQEISEKTDIDNLIPRANTHAWEQTTFQTLVLDKCEANSRKLISIEQNHLDLDNDAAPQIAVGVQLTYRQSWQTKGLALGQLFHTLCLAPGEVVRIAMQTSTQSVFNKTAENVTEDESLQNSATHNRALSEVTRGLASELQQGNSSLSSQSQSQSGASNSGGSFFGLFGGSSNNSRATQNNNSSGFSASFGRRNLATSLNQNIRDRTQQLASGARGRYSATIREIGEDETGVASTRIVANYNHMHTLNIQYYEIVQLHETKLELTAVSKCIFVPIKQIEFTQPDIYNNPVIQQSCSIPVCLQEYRLNFNPALEFDEYSQSLPADLADRRNSILSFQAIFNNYYAPCLKDFHLIKLQRAARYDINQRTLSMGYHPLKKIVKEIKYLDGFQTLNQMKSKLAAEDSAQKNIHVISHSHYNHPSWAPRAFVDFKTGDSNETKSVDLLDIIHMRNFTLDQILKISFSTEVPNTRLLHFFSPALLFVFENNQALFLPPFYFCPTEFIEVEDLFSFNINSEFSQEVQHEYVQHLALHKQRYNYNFYKNIPVTRMATVLAHFNYQDKPLLDLVDPHPIDLIGDYLIFKMNTLSPTGEKLNTVNQKIAQLKSNQSQGNENEDEAWVIQWMSKHGFVFGQVETDIVALPTGGVHAEPILGLSNCAEKLDFTRFVNWHESPIPILPPEIREMNMSGQNQSLDLQLSHFSNRTLRMMNPTALPNPTSLNSVMATLTTPNLFQDLSAQRAVSELAQSGSYAAGTTERHAARQAVRNFATVSEQAAPSAALLNALVSSANTSQPESSHSRLGARINYARNVDAQHNQRSSTSQDMAGEASAPNSHYTFTGDSRSNSGSASSVTNEELAFQNALHGPAATIAKPLMKKGFFADNESRFINDFLYHFKKSFTLPETQATYEVAKKGIKKILKEYSTTRLKELVIKKAMSLGLNAKEISNDFDKIAKHVKTFAGVVILAFKAISETNLSREQFLILVCQTTEKLLTSKTMKLISKAIAKRISPVSLAEAVSLGLTVIIEGIFESPTLNEDEEPEVKHRRQKAFKEKVDTEFKKYDIDPSKIPPLSHPEDNIKHPGFYPSSNPI